MIGLAQPQTTVAMAHKSVSQPYTNYLNVTTIKTTFLANRSLAFPTKHFPLMKLGLNKYIRKNNTLRNLACFMFMRKLLGIRVYRF